MTALELDACVAQAGAFTLGPLSLQLRRGEHVLLRGPSGAGKSVLLATLMGWVPVRAGRVWLRGHPAQRLAVPARGLGWVGQTPALFPHLTVAQNIGYGLRLPASARAACVALWAERLELLPLLARYPQHLSGGEAQRVSLARALAPEPDILLLDEPFSALDAARRAAGWGLLQALQAQGTSLLHVSHEPAVRADRQLRLQAGQLEQARPVPGVSIAPQLS